MFFFNPIGPLPGPDFQNDEDEKQTNEIKIAIPLLDSIDIRGKTIAADALLTQRELARYLVAQRGSHYHFTVKGYQKQLMEDIAFHFESVDRKPDFSTVNGPDHGRIETGNIWTTIDLNEYLHFPYVEQVFIVKRITYFIKNSLKMRTNLSYAKITCIFLSFLLSY